MVRASGCAKATVCRALHRQPDRYPVSEATRDRIAAVAAALGYVPDWRRRMAASTRTGTVAMLFGGDDPLVVVPGEGLLQHIAPAISARGLRMIYERAERGLPGWAAANGHHHVDGALVVRPLPAGLEMATGLGLPMVLVNVLTDLPLPHCLADDPGGAAALARHLVGLGHRRAAFVREGGDSGHHSIAERRDGLAAGMAEVGGTLVSVEGPGALDRLAVLLQSKAAPTAVVGYCWIEGLRLLHWCWQRGLAVPGRISVACFDDAIPTCSSCPSLTAVGVPAAELAGSAVTDLIAQIAGCARPERRLLRLPERLVPRASTGPPPLG